MGGCRLLNNVWAKNAHSIEYYWWPCDTDSVTKSSWLATHPVESMNFRPFVRSSFPDPTHIPRYTYIPQLSIQTPGTCQSRRRPLIISLCLPVLPVVGSPLKHENINTTNLIIFTKTLGLPWTWWVVLSCRRWPPSIYQWHLVGIYLRR